MEFNTDTKSQMKDCNQMLTKKNIWTEAWAATYIKHHNHPDNGAFGSTLGKFHTPLEGQEADILEE